ncbi:hypothetical protein KJ359_004777 [Pestalotiopsis sp. 9143b]|nr:hypothetical protein KJ359_004777 [Pestalotiopsis sp. 9143b]
MTRIFNIDEDEWPTHDYLKKAHILIVAGPLDASAESEERNKYLRLYIREIHEKYPKLHLYGTKKSPKDWNFGLQEVNLEPDFTAAFPDVLQGRRSLSCQFLNSDHVVLKNDAKLPEELKIVGQSDGKIQGLWEPGNVLTFQGLPQFDSGMVKKHVEEMANQDKLNPRDFELYLARASANQPGQEEDATLWGQIWLDYSTRDWKFYESISKVKGSPQSHDVTGPETNNRRVFRFS